MSLVLDKTPPSAIALSLSSLLLGLVAGYFIGSGASIGLFSSPSTTTTSSAYSSSLTPKHQKASWPNSYDVTVHADSSDEEEEKEEIEAQADDEREKGEDDAAADDDDDDDYSDNYAGNPFTDSAHGNEEVKLVLVTRTDLGMTKGKIAAQCGHATLACYKALAAAGPAGVYGRPLLRRWESAGQPKIALQAKGGQEQLETLQAQAISLGLCARVIRDAGRTQIEAGSMTVLGILGPKSVVDKVTGGLKLL